MLSSARWLKAFACLACAGGLLPLALQACGGARGSLEGGVYRKGSIGFRVGEVPREWSPVEVTGSLLAYRDEAHEASVLVNGRCGAKDGDIPLVALTNQLVMGTTERDVTLEETIPFDGREARHTRMTAKLDGVAQLFDLYVLKKDGCVYDLVYVAAPGRASADEGLVAFERFVSGFHTERSAP